MRYRIVTDVYAGFEVQAWRWWWPFWIQCGGINTRSTVEAAEDYARSYAKQRQPRQVVKLLGDLTS